MHPLTLHLSPLPLHTPSSSLLHVEVKDKHSFCNTGRFVLEAECYCLFYSRLSLSAYLSSILPPFSFRLSLRPELLFGMSDMSISAAKDHSFFPFAFRRSLRQELFLEYQTLKLTLSFHYSLKSKTRILSGMPDKSILPLKITPPLSSLITSKSDRQTPFRYLDLPFKTNPAFLALC